MKFLNSVGFILIMLGGQLALLPNRALAQRPATDEVINLQAIAPDQGDAVLVGQVFWRKAQLGAELDTTGYASLPLSGLPNDTLQVEVVGYQTLQLPQPRVAKMSPQINLHLTPTHTGAMVVSAGRTEERQRDALAPVEILTQMRMQQAGARNLAEAVNYAAGLRSEYKCQTCNYSFIRMNGLDGPYTQVLIDGRPMISPLVGLYGLEQLPTFWVDRVEVVRGGGSAMYGASAIAGTVNLITQQPKRNQARVGTQLAWVNGESPDHLANAELSFVSKNGKWNTILMGQQRYRREWDANSDGFSELPRLNMRNGFASVGYHPSKNTRLRTAVMVMNEERRGGDQLDLAPELRQQSEERDALTTAAILDLDQKLGASRLQVFAAAHRTTREHYTGVAGPEGFGDTEEWGGLLGAMFHGALASEALQYSLGLEGRYDDVLDQIPDYQYRVDQAIGQLGAFGQVSWAASTWLDLSAGGRLTTHDRIAQPVFTPRLAALITPSASWRLRAVYAEGFRAPQAFQADLHLSFAGGGVSTIKLDPGLATERSRSYTLSADWQETLARMPVRATVTGFYTALSQPFILEEIPQPETQTVQLLRTNGSDQRVTGVTAEAYWQPVFWLETEVSVTVQQAEAEQPIAWSETYPAQTQLLRTPSAYGFFRVAILPTPALTLAATGSYTGPMDVPHYAGAPGVPADELVRSPTFLDMNLRVAYRQPLPRVGTLQLSGAVQNVLNAYQQDFDRGPNRDSDFVYGPLRPRTLVLGLELVL